MSDNIMNELSSEKFSLKDHLFNRGKIQLISNEIVKVYSEFQNEKFVNETIEAFPSLELKERIVHIAYCLSKYLPESYPEALQIMINSLPNPCNPDLTDNDFGDFIYSPYSHFVVLNGCNANYIEISLDALEQITMRFSAEYAIRYFINTFPQRTLERIKEWAKHPHYHVRRLASEGTRPKLPWSQKINLNVEQTIPVLDLLFSDSTRFVTRSVANHLNDISKINPGLVIETLRNWKNSNSQSENEMDFIIKHSLRTLLKSGNNEAFEFIGIGQNPPIIINSFTLTEKVNMNAYLEFNLEIKANKNVPIILDYVITFVNKAGEMKSKKVFKLKQVNLNEGESVNISKRHLMKQYMTTRTLYPGEHLLQIQINGNVMIENNFSLL